MKFIVKKDDLYSGIKIVERATSVKALQPVLMNVFIETIGKGTVRLVATDLDYTIIAEVDAQVEEEGKITVPSKILNDIVSKLNDNLITIETVEGQSIVNITCQKSKFDVNGISANEFPQDFILADVNEADAIEIDLKPFVKSVKQAGFAAASIDTSNILSGIVCNISENLLEIASTDGNRLARYRESITNKDKKSKLLIIPSKILNEVIKMSSFIDEDTVKIYSRDSKIIIKTNKTTTIARLLDGQYPKYNMLIPETNPKIAKVNVSQLISALERASVMVNDKTNIVCLTLADNNMKLEANTPNSGKFEDDIDIDYTDEELTIAFNYKYVLEVLKNIDSDNVKIEMNTALSATVFRPDSEEDFISIIMPVQITGNF